MPPDLPTITTQDGRRTFACAPLALVIFIVNADERILVLSNPKAAGRWEVINGAFEHGETLLAGCLREIREEGGDQLRVRPLSVIHAHSFPYDPAIPHMTSLSYVFAYEGGDVIPGDDMAGSRVHWASLDEIASGAIEMVVPLQPWLFARAIEVYGLLKDRPPVEHQPPLESLAGRKYAK